MAFDTWFPFNTTERKTLEKKFSALEDRIAELEEAVANLPDPTP